MKAQSSLAEVQYLDYWYKSATGRKVSLLEQREIVDRELQNFKTIPVRTEQVIRIYENTRAGFLSASMAVELEYAGWLASGCMQKVRSIGESEQVNAEQIYGKLLREQGTVLETVFRQSALHEMEFILSSLSSAELIEYADTTHRGSTVFATLVFTLESAVREKVEQLYRLP